MIVDELCMWPVPQDVRREAELLCGDNSFSLVFICRKSDIADDNHLFLVIAVRRTRRVRPFVVWTFNSSLHTLGLGHYDLTLSEAIRLVGGLMYERGTDE